LKRLLYGIILTAGPLLAAEEGGAAKPDLEIWKWLNFLMLAGLIGWFAVKQGGPALAGRSKEIREGLAAGEKAKAEADARAKEVQAKLNNLQTEVAALRTTALAEREREATRIRQDFEREIARIQRQSEMEIDSAGKMARLELQSFAAKLAVELAEQKLRARMTPEVQAALLQGFLTDFPSSNGSHADLNRADLQHAG
jgi:F-type H+-transporting ATPase subunit b